MINSKINLGLNWTRNCVISDIAGDTAFKITNTKLYVTKQNVKPTKQNVKPTKQLNEGFKRFVYWSEYKTKIESKHLDDNYLIRFYLDVAF